MAWFNQTEDVADNTAAQRLTKEHMDLHKMTNSRRTISRQAKLDLIDKKRNRESSDVIPALRSIPLVR